ncbi:hypothetical protein [Streptomyces violaceusniger]|uniref:Uncharacterized protein n=1 Tax=Streptomyces violaceusniger (strain Tu 4113) TaxID=653045 RepID=G2PHP0_STRV4|nr:hypothetical protein [Streptomyces violaceusniger]AEM88841.1 hypothetical protein Strvi_0065 [Streptomyces violaceusniger Tu 4113]
MAIYISATSAPRRGRWGLESPTLHLHPGCPGAGCDSPDTITVNRIGEAYAIMRALKSGLRYDGERYVRNRVHTFRLSGDVAEETLTREDVAALPVSRSNPDHPEYGEWREAVISNAPVGRKAVTECGMISPAFARRIGIKGVYLWDTAPREAGAAPERVNDTTTEMLTVGADNAAGEPVYVRTLPERHSVHRGKTTADVFRREGYWFTVPGDFPASLPDSLHQSRETFAVFQSPDVVPGVWVWVVRAEGPSGRNLGASTESRRVAVRLALAALARLRTETAADIMATRRAIGLEEVPPVRIAVTDGTWVLHVRCACDIPEADAVGETATVGDAGELFADECDPWKLCQGSPRVLFFDDRTTRGRIVAHGARGPKGEPSVFVDPQGGGPRYAVRLTEIGGRNI